MAFCFTTMAWMPWWTHSCGWTLHRISLRKKWEILCIQCISVCLRTMSQNLGCSVQVLRRLSESECNELLASKRRSYSMKRYDRTRRMRITCGGQGDVSGHGHCRLQHAWNAMVEACWGLPIFAGPNGPNLILVIRMSIYDFLKAHTGSITNAIGAAYVGTRKIGKDMLQSQVTTKRQFRQKLERTSGILSHIQPPSMLAN